MADDSKIRAALEAAIAGAVREHSSMLEQELVDRMAVLIAQQEPEPGSLPTDHLNAAVASVQDAVSQTDILKALLEGAAHFSVRCGLLVVRGATASGWQSRGFLDNDIFKIVAVDCTRGLADRVLKSRMPAAASAVEFDSAFVQRFGAPADGNVLLLPLVIKEKVAALVYADGGELGNKGLDRSAMELLVRSAGNWLELISFRKLSPDAAAQPEPSHPTPRQVAPQMTRPVAPQQAAPAQLAVRQGGSVAVAPAEDEVHNKARRFAKLLVEEIKLYNQGKVSEGRANRDLFDRLREDIEKSRATYEKRYGQTVTDSDYFTSELIRILADNDRALLGPNFRW